MCEPSTNDDSEASSIGPRCEPLSSDHGEERTEGGRSVRQSVGGVAPGVTIRAAKRVFRCQIHPGRNGERALVGVGCDRSKVVKSELSVVACERAGAAKPAVRR